MHFLKTRKSIYLLPSLNVPFALPNPLSQHLQLQWQNVFLSSNVTSQCSSEKKKNGKLKCYMMSSFVFVSFIKICVMSQNNSRSVASLHSIWPTGLDTRYIFILLFTYTKIGIFGFLGNSIVASCSLANSMVRAVFLHAQGFYVRPF